MKSAASEERHGRRNQAEGGNWNAGSTSRKVFKKSQKFVVGKSNKHNPIANNRFGNYFVAFDFIEYLDNFKVFRGPKNPKK